MGTAKWIIEVKRGRNHAAPCLFYVFSFRRKSRHVSEVARLGYFKKHSMEPKIIFIAKKSELSLINLAV